MWKPMGGGDVDAIVEQTIAFTLSGDDYEKIIVP